MSEDRLRALIRDGLAPHVEQVPEAPTWDELVERVSSGPRRWTPPGWVAAASAVVGMLLLVGVPILLGRSGGPSPASPSPIGSVTTVVTTVGTPPTSTITVADPSTQLTVTRIALDEDIPLQVYALAGSSVAVIDLEERVTTVYPPGAHALPDGPNDGAVMTSARQWITWNDGNARLTPERFDEAPVELGPAVRRMIPGIAPALRVVPAPDGRRAWLVQVGLGYGDQDEPTLVELVSLPDGTSLAHLEINANAYPVAATANGLVVTINQWSDTGDGYVTTPGSETVVHVLSDGTLEPVGDGVAIAAGSTRTARLACPANPPGCDLYRSENQLIVSDPDGSNAIEIAPPFAGTWRTVGGPGTPSEAMPLQTVSPDGSTLLVSLGRDPDTNTVPADAVLFAVDLDTGETRTIAELAPTANPLATWSADGQWVALLDLSDLHLVNVADPATTIALQDVIPPDHFPLAAG